MKLEYSAFALIFSFAIGVSAEPTHALIGSTWTSERLCALDMGTGVATPFTDAPADSRTGFMGIAYDPFRDLLYATSPFGGEPPNALIEVDRLNGQHLATHQGLWGSFYYVAEGDVAFDPLTGHVFALRSGGAVSIWNSLSGAGAGYFELPVANDSSGLAFDPAGNLWLVNPNSREAADAELLRIDKSTGVILETRTLSQKIGVVAGLAFHPVTGEAWIADSCRGSDLCTGNRLFTLDVSSGTLTLVGETGLPISGLAFVPAAPVTVAGSFSVHDGPDGNAPAVPAGFSTTINFGTVPRAVTTTRPVTVKNNGSVDIEILTAGARDGFGVAGFPASPTLLAPGQTLTFNAAIPSSLASLGGAYNGTLSIHGRLPGTASYLPFEARLQASVPVAIEYGVAGPYGPVSNNQPAPVVFQRNPGGSGSVLATFIVSSTGADPLTVNSVTLPPGFATTASFPALVQPGRTFGIPVTSSGPAPGLYQGNLVIQTNHDGLPTFTVPLYAVHQLPRMEVSFSGVLGAQLPGAEVSYGETSRGLAVSRQFTIKNTLTPSLVISSADIPTGFTLSSPPVFPVTLALNQSLFLDVRLTATTPGINQGTLVIHSNDFDFPNFDVDLTGKVDPSSVVFFGFNTFVNEHPNPQVSASAFSFVPGALSYDWDLDGDGAFDDFAGPMLQLTGADGPSNFDARVRITDPDGFGKTFSGVVPVNNNPPNVTGTVPFRAVAGVPLSFSLTAEDAPADVMAGFTWASDWGDGTSDNSASGAPATNDFLHTYTQPGVQRNIIITVSDKDGGIRQVSRSVFVDSGVMAVFNGATPAAEAELRHAVDSFSFSRSLGQSEERVITLQNRSGAPAAFGPVTVPAGFSLVNPPTWPVALAAGGSLQVTVRFNAASFGVSQGDMEINTGDPLLPVFRVGLRGEVEAPDITVNNFGGERYDFANLEGFFSISPGTGAFDGETFTIEASGPPLTISSIELPPGFEIANAPGFPLVLDNTSQDIRIQSSTPANSMIKGWVRINSNDIDENPFEFYVRSSNGNAGDLVVVTAEGFSSFNNQYSAAGVVLNNQPEPLVFGLPDGSSRTLRLVNQGNVAITVTGVTLPPGFAFATPPSFPIVLSAFANQTLPAIELTATDTGVYAGTLVIASNDPDEPAYQVPVRAVIDGDGGAGGPITFVSPPVLSPATSNTPATFSATLHGSPGTQVDIEGSRDLGVDDPWSVFHTFTIGASGEETLSDITWPDSAGEPKGFFRARAR